MRSHSKLAPALGMAALLASIVPSKAFAGFTLIRAYDGPLAGGEFGYSCIVVGDIPAALSLGAAVPNPWGVLEAVGARLVRRMVRLH